MKPDHFGFVSLKDAFATLKSENILFSKACIRNALRDGKIPHRRSSDGSRAKYYVRIDEILFWLQQFNGVKNVDLTNLRK